MKSKKTKIFGWEISKRRLLNTLGPYVAGFCAIATVIMGNIVSSFTGRIHDYDTTSYIIDHFLYSLPFSLLFLFDIPMRFTQNRAIKKVLVKQLTFICILIHGITGTISMFLHLPPEINSYPAYFWFTYGILFFFLGSANFQDLILYGAVYFGTVFGYIVNAGDFGMDEKIVLTVTIFQLLHFTPVSLLARSRIHAIQHAFKQLEKVFYPHQIKMIRRSRELEQTMPTLTGEACVICFDIVSSSQIRHDNLKGFLRNLFARCNSLMMEGYNGIDMASRGYRIKEMGDGFLCSVGYPFRSTTGDMTKDTLDLALRFHEVFAEEVAALGYDKPIHCCIGIAHGTLSGFFPESGAKEYDLHGSAIALATRYESMRKLLFPLRPPASLLVLQERIWNNLPPEDRQNFVEVSLVESGLSVRDDPDARILCYRLLGEASSAVELPTSA